MKSWELHFCLLASVFFVIAWSDEESTWTYSNDGAGAWSRQFPQCRAPQQSPVALSSASATLWLPAAQRARGFRLFLDRYSTAQDGILANNGKTVGITFNQSDPSVLPRVIINDNNTVSAFILEGVHFHWPSEHVMNNERYPLEMHMVHRSVENDVLVLSMLFTTNCVTPAAGMTEVAAGVRRVAAAGAAVPFAHFTPDGLLPPMLQRDCNYFKYDGSLTTPPCSRGVTWLVHGEPLCVGADQLEAFKGVRGADGQPMAGNSRPLQDAAGRQVLLLPCMR